MSITRWSRFVVSLASVAAAAALFAAPPSTPSKTAPTAAQAKPTPSAKLPTLTPNIPVVPDHPGVHINAVHIQGNCGSPATYQVEIQNNLHITAEHGQVDLRAANGAQLHSAFDNLRAGERRTLTIPTPWILTCQTNEVGQPSCVEVRITMEPDLTANGQVWDNVAHTVCVGAAKGTTPLVSDKQHK